MNYNRRKKLSDLRSRNFRFGGNNPMDDYNDAMSNRNDGWVDSAEEIDDIRYGDPVVSLNTPELSNQDTSNVDDEKTKAGKLFGFIRGRVDEATDEFRMRQKLKNEAYKNYLKQKPSLLAAKYEDEYNRKLDRQFNPTSSDDRWNSLFSNVSSGMDKVSRMLGGSKSPEQVMGFRGTVFGDLPGAGTYGNQGGSSYQDNIRNALGGSTMQQPQQEYQNQMMIDDTKYGRPGVVGSQVPKYQSWPKNAKPGSTYVRVQDIDQWGKKRSYMRKARVPPEQMPQISGQVPMQQPSISMVEPQVMPQQNLISGNINPLAFQTLIEGLSGNKNGIESLNRKVVFPSNVNNTQDDFQKKVNAYIVNKPGEPGLFAYKTGKFLNGKDLTVAAYLR
jgi:hypothetical protein